MRFTILILTFILASNSSIASNPFWLHIDKKMITSIVKLSKNNPKEIESYFKTQRIVKCDTTKENLGFGWTIWQPEIGGGYVTISATFYYFRDSLVSYTLKPELPAEQGLSKRYKKWYKNYFEYSGSAIQDFTFNSTAILNPLADYKGDFISGPPEILNYMTPASGTMYGYAGGGMIMQNRKAFNEIKDRLTNKQVVLMLYSINPASRLTAIEYYWKHKDRFDKQEILDKWVEIVLIGMPTVKSMSGCFFVTENTRALVYSYSLLRDK